MTEACRRVLCLFVLLFAVVMSVVYSKRWSLTGKRSVNILQISASSSDEKQETSSVGIQRQRWSRSRLMRSDIVKLRGGSTATMSTATESLNKQLSGPSTCSVVVSTSLGTMFLDKKKKLVLPSNSTVAQLKEQLQVKFPGSPPIGLQRLFYGNSLLRNEEVLGNISSLPNIPILLDMITGTSAYNKTLSVTQALDAYVSSVVQLAYLGDMLTHAVDNQIPTNPSETSVDQPSTAQPQQEIMKTIYYRQLYEVVNASIYEMYAEDIAIALEEEKNPEAVSDDTQAWRKKSGKIRSPLALAFAKEFDINMQTLKSYLYFSILLVIFAYMGSPTPQSTTLMLTMIPIMWISKLRHLRILSKIGMNLILLLLPTLDFLLPLFPATLQVIATQQKDWFEDSDEWNLRNLEEKLDNDNSANTNHKEEKEANEDVDEEDDEYSEEVEEEEDE